MLIIGRNTVLETLKINQKSIKKIILLDSLNDNKIKEIIEKAKSNNIDIEVLPKNNFEKVFDKKDKSDGISQGIAAEVEDFKYSKTSEILISTEGNKSVCLAVLDEIQDPHNFGAIIRSAEATGIDGIIISDKNTVKVNHTVIKSSSGATNYIKISKESNIYSTIEYLKEKGFEWSDFRSCIPLADSPRILHLQKCPEAHLTQDLFFGPMSSLFLGESCASP